MNVFPFIEAEKAEQRNVVKACELLEVSRSAFYEWHQHVPSARAARRRRARRAHRGDLRRVAGHLRLAAGASGAAPRRRARRPQAGRSDHAPQGPGRAGAGDGGPRPPSPILRSAAVDLLKRAFGPGTVELDRVYVGDITYIWTWEGWAVPRHRHRPRLPTGRRAGRMADHMRAELVCDALRMAIEHRRPAPGLMFHSDRGTQYTTTEFTDLLADARDDPVAVAASAVLGQRGGGELLRVAEARVHLPARLGRPATQVRRAVFDYIEVFFNRRRLHSSLGYLHTRRIREPRSATTTPLTRHNQHVRRTGSTPHVL